jgi:hypothetical protein
VEAGKHSAGVQEINQGICRELSYNITANHHINVLERCVLVSLRDHLLQLLHRAQHGFIPGRSCVNQLVEVLNYIGSLLDSGLQTDVIYLNMSKALDKVQHSLIISRLRQFNISGSLLSRFTSYLNGRRQTKLKIIKCLI